MKIDRLVVQEFRNHVNKTIELGGRSVVIVGANGTGKTNLLEAIYLLAMGESFRETPVETMVHWGVELGQVAAKVTRDDEQVELAVMVTGGLVLGKRVAKRRYFVNGVARNKQTLVGRLVVVSFRPEDLRVVEGSPARRRRFIDEVLVQVDREFAGSLSAYQRGLLRRNKLLDMVRERRAPVSSLAFWTELVIKHGTLIQEKRRRYCDFVNEQPEALGVEMELGYEPKVISEARMSEYADREIAAGHQLIGPHRDDFVMFRELGPREKKNLALYGSRGEQRLGVLWLKMRAMGYVEQVLGEKPVLLLDDIFSELDHEHRSLVFGLFGGQQTIATTADRHYVEGLGKEVVRVVLDGKEQR